MTPKEDCMAVIWVEDFESNIGATSQAGVTRSAPDRTNVNGDNDGAGDFSFRSDQPNDGSLSTYPVFFTGLQGFGWLAEDTDGISGAAATVETLQWSGIDITGQTTLEFSGLFGAYDVTTSPLNDVYRWEANEYIVVEVQIDGGGFTEILRFESDNAGGLSGDMRIDTNGDGVGDGTLLTTAMQEITASISGTGSTLDLRIEFTTNSANENLAFDNISITDGAAASIDGTPNADNLVGTAGDDVINGLGDNDTLSGGGTNETDGGNDTLNGDAGNDRLFGQGGNDILNGGAGNDQLWGQEGADALDGGTGIDGAYYINATAGVALNVFTGGTAGHAAGDTYTNIERFFGSQFGDTLDGASGNDFLYGLGGNDTINGAGGADRIVGGLGIDTISGGADNDTIYGSQGGDLLNGDAGNDTLRGGADNDMINGGDDDDALHAGSGNDTLNGDAGNDSLYGNEGTNTLNGGAGNDKIFAGTGADAIDGGTGIDSVYYSAATAGVNANLATGGTSGEATGDTYTNIENLYGSQHGDILQGDAANNLIVGLSGDDELIGQGGNDRLIGGNGNDRLEGGEGNDILIGQADADTFAFVGGSSVGEVDRIYDFEDGVDMIELFFFGSTGDFSDLSLTQVGNHVRIEEDTDSTGSSNDAAILVYNTMVADLTADDFNIILPEVAEPLSADFIKSAPSQGDAFAGIETAQMPVAFFNDEQEIYISDFHDVFA